MFTIFNNRSIFWNNFLYYNVKNSNKGQLFITPFVAEVYEKYAVHWIISISCIQFISMYYYMVTFYNVVNVCSQNFCTNNMITDKVLISKPISLLCFAKLILMFKSHFCSSISKAIFYILFLLTITITENCFSYYEYLTWEI